RQLLKHWGVGLLASQFSRHASQTLQHGPIDAFAPAELEAATPKQAISTTRIMSFRISIRISTLNITFLLCNCSLIGS
ncbi:MAG TPA: hypothetical protein VNI02_11770, partial [Blastocatellia bacterium]|nr:hypothetical protein [Blastocatellia bacterium]